MLMGAAHNALWAFNARVSLTLPVCHRPQAATLALRLGAVRSPVTVVPSCGLETRSWRTDRMARHKQECIRLPYTAARWPPNGLSLSGGYNGTPRAGANTQRPRPRISSGQNQNGNNQLCFQPTAQIFSHEDGDSRRVHRGRRQWLQDYRFTASGSPPQRHSPGKESAMPACTQV